MGRAELIGQQDAARVVSYEVVDHLRIMHGHQMDAFAAIAGDLAVGLALGIA